MAENFNKISKTLFVPLYGRIYTTEHFPNILNDITALKLKNKIPPEEKPQSQYTYIASAVRSRNIDIYINNFLRTNPDGIIVEIGCGLESTYFRHPNIKTRFYDIDLPEVIDYREKIMPLGENQKLIKGDLFKEEWIEQIKKECGNKPILIIAGGLFHYFPRDNVVNAIKNMLKFDNAELVFDALNSLGIKGIKKYMKELGHSDAQMYFYVNDPNELAREIGPNVEVIEEKKYYSMTPTEGLDFMTKVQMNGADLFYMVKMIHLKLKK